jgi:hypothetical protein
LGLGAFGFARSEPIVVTPLAAGEWRSAKIRTILLVRLDSLSVQQSEQLAIWMYSFAGMDLQLFSLNLNNRLCHSGVFG